MGEHLFHQCHVENMVVQTSIVEVAQTPVFEAGPVAGVGRHRVVVVFQNLVEVREVVLSDLIVEIV